MQYFHFKLRQQIVAVTLTKIGHGLDKRWSEESSINIVAKTENDPGK